MPCDSIYSVKRGDFEFKKSLFGKKPKFDRVFSLTAAGGDYKSLHLQCVSSDSKDTWIKAFNSLLIYRHKSKLELK